MPKKDKRLERKYGRQRVKRGYSDRDVWDIDLWFLSVMPKMLQQLKETRHGSPAELGESYVNDDGVMVNDKCHEEWDKILDRMIFLLGEMKVDISEISREIVQYREDCKNEFFDLFSKYFWYLWD